MENLVQLIRDENMKRSIIPNKDELLQYIHRSVPLTGRSDILYCNPFLNEANKLLENAIFLYEDGYFDCAFYSIRQASELLDTMLYITHKNEETMKYWKDKERFPSDSKMRTELGGKPQKGKKKEKEDGNAKNKPHEAYAEIKALLKDYFKKHTALKDQANKVIHKQGFDTFYIIRNNPICSRQSSVDEELEFFLKFLKYTIGISKIINIILDPMSLVLADENVSNKIYEDSITEPVDVGYFEEYLDMPDVISRIKSSHYYQEFIKQFKNKDDMNSAVCNVIRGRYWDIKSLDIIELQSNMLNEYEYCMFEILKLSIRVVFFYLTGVFGFYITSINNDYQMYGFREAEFQSILNENVQFNNRYKNSYISFINIKDRVLYFEHNELLNNNEIDALKKIEFKNI